MITVESLIDVFCTNSLVKPFVSNVDRAFMESVRQQIAMSQSLTEKQGQAALRIIKKYQKRLSEATQVNILDFVANPVFKFPVRKQKLDKKISIIKNKKEVFYDKFATAKLIKVEFPYNEKYIELIRNVKSKDPLVVGVYSKEEQAWVFNLSEKSVMFLMPFFRSEGFDADDEFKEYMIQYRETIDNHIDDYIPMLSIENSVPVYKNVGKTVPPLQTTDILSAIFEARRRGISVWDEEISYFLNNHTNPFTKAFLESPLNKHFYINSNSVDIEVLKEIILNLMPCIFVIPGGSEVEKFTVAYNFLKKIGISNNNISVLFRLSNTGGHNFNEFVKSQGLNNPVDENTKFAFVSGKMPKPLLKSNIYFNSIINMGFDNPHYTSKYLIEKHQNLIYYSEKPAQERYLWQSQEY